MFPVGGVVFRSGRGRFGRRLARPPALALAAGSERGRRGRNGLFLTEPESLRQRRSLRRVIRGDHRIVGRQIPLLAILLRRHAVHCEVPSQRFEFEAVLQAHQIVWRDGLADRHSRRWRLDDGRSLFSVREPLQGCVNSFDQGRQFAPRHGILRDERRDDISGEFYRIGCRHNCPQAFDFARDRLTPEPPLRRWSGECSLTPRRGPGRGKSADAEAMRFSCLAMLGQTLTIGLNAPQHFIRRCLSLNLRLVGTRRLSHDSVALADGPPIPTTQFQRIEADLDGKGGASTMRASEISPALGLATPAPSRACLIVETQAQPRQTILAFGSDCRE